MKMDYGWSRVRSSVPATLFSEDWHGIISTAIISLALIQVGQLSITGEKMCTFVLVYRLGSLPRNSVDRLTDCLDMTIVVDWDVKPQIKQNKKINC